MNECGFLYLEASADDFVFSVDFFSFLVRNNFGDNHVDLFIAAMIHTRFSRNFMKVLDRFLSQSQSCILSLRRAQGFNFYFQLRVCSDIETFPVTLKFKHTKLFREA